MGNFLQSNRNGTREVARYHKLNTDQSCCLPQSVMEIILVLVNGQVYKIFIDSSLLVYQLKHIVYYQISPTLLPNNMALWFKKQLLDDLEIVGSKVFHTGLIQQKKAPLSQISRIWVKPEVQDQITLQKGVALMSCGHLIGRTAIIQFMKATIAQQKWELLCPFEGCGKQWSYKLCHKVGNFTWEEDRYFSQHLTKNLINMRAKNCPGCACLYLDESVCNRVVCANPKCKYGQFCKLCLKKWANPTQNECGNTECFQLQLFKSKVGTIKMDLYLDAALSQRIQIQVPTHRNCPTCRCLIEHNQGCKHISCSFCKSSFCWICMTVKKGAWICGAYNNYCGFIAPNPSV